MNEHIVLIAGKLNSNNRVYTGEAVQQAAGMYAGTQVVHYSGMLRSAEPFRDQILGFVDRACVERGVLTIWAELFEEPDFDYRLVFDGEGIFARLGPHDLVEKITAVRGAILVLPDMAGEWKDLPPRGEG